MYPHIYIKTGDITKEKVCAIVNAANSSLMGGGGVDGAIHRAGGPTILEACKQIRSEQYAHGLPTGGAVATTAGHMPSSYVIHTVGPIYPGCKSECERLLSTCYTNSLQTAVGLGCKEIAFPAISTGIYGYPKDEAARIAYLAVKGFLEAGNTINVFFVLHNEADRKIFEESIAGLND